MARDADALLIRKWAETGDVQTPEDRGLTRSIGWPADFSAQGGRKPTREVFNQLFREISGLATELQRRGILEWSAAVDYEHPAVVMGPTSGVLFLSTRDSGPNSGGAVDPEGSQASSAWTRSVVDLPVSSTVRQGLIETATTGESLDQTVTDKATPPSGVWAALAEGVSRVTGVGGNVSYGVPVGRNDGPAITASEVSPVFVKVPNLFGFTPPKTSAIVGPAAEDSMPFLAVTDIPAGAQTAPVAVYSGGYFHQLRLEPSSPPSFQDNSPIYLVWSGSTWRFSPTPGTGRWGRSVAVGTVNHHIIDGTYDCYINFWPWWNLQFSDVGVGGTVSFGVPVGRNDGSAITASETSPTFVKVPNIFGFTPPRTSAIVEAQTEDSMPFLAVTDIPAGAQTAPVAVYSGGYFHQLRLEPSSPPSFANDGPIYLLWLNGSWTFSPTPGTGRWGHGVAVGKVNHHNVDGLYDCYLDLWPWWNAQFTEGLVVSSATHGTGDWSEDDLYTWLSPALPAVGQSRVVSGSVAVSAGHAVTVSRADRTADDTVQLYGARAVPVPGGSDNVVAISATRGTTTTAITLRSMSY